MDTKLTSLPGYRYCEYMLVLSPHEDLRNRITGIKKEFNARFKADQSGVGKPHIMLAQFTVWQMMEEKIVNRLKVIAMGNPPIKVMLNNFGSYPSHTICINVTTKIPIQNIVKEMRSFRRLMKSPEKDPYFNEDPHITIARKLMPDQYEKSWLEYAHRNFTGSFIADGMLLLKRYQGEKAYQIVQRFEFGNLPVLTRQGELFG
jgi:2'-5' RNA ligase